MAQAKQGEAFDAREFIERYYAAIWELANGTVEALREWETDDIVYELPWSEKLQEFTGIETHVKVMSHLPANLKNYEIHMTAFYPTADPNEVVVESTGGGETMNGFDYRNEYVQFITFREGKIARVREFFDTIRARDITR